MSHVPLSSVLLSYQADLQEADIQKECAPLGCFPQTIVRVTLGLLPGSSGSEGKGLPWYVLWDHEQS